MGWRATLLRDLKKVAPRHVAGQDAVLVFETLVRRASKQHPYAAIPAEDMATKLGRSYAVIKRAQIALQDLGFLVAVYPQRGGTTEFFVLSPREWRHANLWKPHATLSPGSYQKLHEPPMSQRAIWHADDITRSRKDPR